MVETILEVPSNKVFGIIWDAPLWSVHLLETQGFFRVENFVALGSVLHLADAKWQGDDKMPGYVEKEK